MILDLLKMLGEGKNMFSQMVVKNGDLPWNNVKNHLKQIQKSMYTPGN